MGRELGLLYVILDDNQGVDEGVDEGVGEGVGEGVVVIITHP